MCMYHDDDLPRNGRNERNESDMYMYFHPVCDVLSMI